MNISELLENLKTNIDTMSMGEKVLGGLATALLAMLVVFIILALISLIIRVINTQPKETNKESTNNSSQKSNTTNIVRDAIAKKAKEDLLDEDELIAVITSAIVAATGKNIVVKRITRTNNNKSNWEKISNI